MHDDSQCFAPAIRQRADSAADTRGIDECPPVPVIVLRRRRSHGYDEPVELVADKGTAGDAPVVRVMKPTSLPYSQVLGKPLRLDWTTADVDREQLAASVIADRPSPSRAFDRPVSRLRCLPS